jgi:hypothetical protein
MNEKDEIEITSQMIEAGANAILEAYGGLDLHYPATEVAIAVFRAMIRSAETTPALKQERTR